jgi:hypothetical protein
MQANCNQQIFYASRIEWKKYTKPNCDPNFILFGYELLPQT